MPNPKNIVFEDTQITQILTLHKGNSAQALFEHYRIAGINREDFVAALIGRLCVLETRRLYPIREENHATDASSAKIGPRSRQRKVECE